jgi:hypothetical protein
MNKELAGILRAAARNSSADQLVELVVRTVEGIDQFGFIRIFKEVFPQVPLRILKEASTSRHLVGPDGLNETATNQLLGPWLKVVSEKADD